VKHFLIKYQFKNGSSEDWHREIERFIAALDTDPALKGRVSYRCLKASDGSGYYHLAAVADDETSRTLQSRDFFAAYKEKTHHFSGGTATTVPLELIVETKLTA
jgi:hypothetical protein